MQLNFIMKVISFCTIGFAGDAAFANYQTAKAFLEKKDYKNALIAAKDSMENDTRSLKLHGEIHLNGTGVSSNASEALFYFQKAAELGDAEAQRITGYHYQEGLGVESDFELMTDKVRPYHSHPAFWAPFSLMGDGTALN